MFSTKRNRIVSCSIALFASSILVFCLAETMSRRKMVEKSLPVIVEGVGGHECGYKNCRDQPDITKCSFCCGQHCADLKGCAEFCLEWFGAKEALTHLTKSAMGLQANTITDANERAIAVNFMEKMQDAKVPVVKNMAIALAKDTPGVRLMN